MSPFPVPWFMWWGEFWGDEPHGGPAPKLVPASALSVCSGTLPSLTSSRMPHQGFTIPVWVLLEWGLEWGRQQEWAMLWFPPCLSWWRAGFKSCPGFLGSQGISTAVHKLPDQERETCTPCLVPYSVSDFSDLPPALHFPLGLILQQTLQYCKNTSPEILLRRK